MTPDSVIKSYIIGNKAEVTRMILTDYNEEETMRRFKEEYFEDGVAVGRRWQTDTGRG